MTDPLDDLDGATNVLLLAPSMGSEAGGFCTEHLLADRSDARQVLWITYRRSPADCVASIADADLPHRSLAVIAVGDLRGSIDDPELADVTVDSVPSATDLTGLGIEINQYLSGSDGDLALCFDSLSALSQYVDLETLYEFLHTVVGQLYAAGARAHFHMDPGAHDRQTIDTVASLFDAVVTLGEGEPTVRRRQILE